MTNFKCGAKITFVNESLAFFLVSETYEGIKNYSVQKIKVTKLGIKKLKIILKIMLTKW